MCVYVCVHAHINKASNCFNTLKPIKPTYFSAIFMMPVWWGEMHATVSTFYVGPGDLNSGPHACVANISPTEPST